MARALFADLVLSNTVLVTVLLVLWNTMRWGAAYMREHDDNPNPAEIHQLVAGGRINLWFAVAVAWTTVIMLIEFHLGQDPTRPGHFWGLLRVAGWVPGVIAGVHFVARRPRKCRPAPPPTGPREQHGP